MFLKISAGIGVLVAAFLIYVAVQPADFKISRQITIHAKPEVIFPYINNSKKGYEWMPWKEIDPQVVITMTGPEEGVGAGSSWTSKGKMGEGKAVVTESIPNKSVKTELTYTKPMAMTQQAEMTLVEGPDGTVANWTVTGKNTFMGRLFCTFMNMDKMVGGQFEKGLNTLKGIVEGPDKK